MPYLPFIMRTITLGMFAFLSGIIYINVDNMINREQREVIAGKYQSMIVALEAYRVENGFFPMGSNWHHMASAYMLGNESVRSESRMWEYTGSPSGYTLCYQGPLALASEFSEQTPSYLCSQPDDV